MKTKIFKLLLIFSPLMLVTSCDDFMAVNDQELIGPDLVNSNEEFVVGLWSNLYYCLDNGFQEVGNAMLASACDEAHSNVPFGATNSFNQGSWNSYGNPYNRSWDYLYQQIENACHFLNVSDTTQNKGMVFFHDYKKFPDNGNKYNTFLFNLKSYRMDAKFFKAYCHFQLWRAYGRIAIVDDQMNETQAKELKQATTQEVVEYIRLTLNDVINEYDELEHMPNSKYSAGRWGSNDLGRITKGAALALKCRMFLYAASPLYNDGVYDKVLCDSAARTAGQIINMNIYSNQIGYVKMQFNRTVANPENILDSRPNTVDANYMEHWNYPKGGLGKYVNVDNLCSNATCPSQNLVDAYAKLNGYSDAAPFEKRDPRLKQTILCDGELANEVPVQSYVAGAAGIGEKNATPTGYYLKKFVVDKVTLPVGTKASRLWYIFRYSEVLLNYAEAMFNAYDEGTYKGFIHGVDMNALEVLNKVHLRNNLNAGNVAIQSPLTNDKIRNERQVELAFEGHRFWDVRRWKIAMQTENAPLRGMYITNNGASKSYNPNYIVNKRVFKAGMEHFPIPYTEMHKYPSWRQNWW